MVSDGAKMEGTGGTDTTTGGGGTIDQPPPVVIMGGSTGTPMERDKPTPNCSEACSDFPAEPIFDNTGPSMVPANAPELFGDPGNMSGTGPCVHEPALAVDGSAGALFPANWLRPRFRFTPAGTENLFEIRLSADIEANDLVVYTTATVWAMPDDIWHDVSRNVHRQPITVTIRGVDTNSPGTPTGSVGSFQIAPVNARGSLVYWATTSQNVNPDTSKLVGFSVGDEGTVDAVTITQAGDRGVIAPNGDALRVAPDPEAVGTPGHVECIGCHTSTPDGEAVAFTDLWPWNVVVASVEEDSQGVEPDYVTEGASRLLSQPWLGMSTFSKAHWEEDRRILVTTYGGRITDTLEDTGFDIIKQGDDTLAWFNLAADVDIPFTAGDPATLNAAVDAAEGTAWGRINLEGEPRSAVAPDFSNDGQTIVYTSATNAVDGRIGDGNTEIDLHYVPFNDGAGGPVTLVDGASEPGVAEYYPAFSADDKFIAFNRVATLDTAAIYYRADGEIYVVPTSGGPATRLAANDPPACGGEVSPGVINSWAKWSPSVLEHEGKAYYFLIFSSARAYPGQEELPAGPFSPPDRRMSQLYMASVVADVETGDIETFGAVYLWNQDPTWSNLTPAWDVFQLPPVPGPK